MVGLGFAAAFAATGGAMIGRQAGRRLFRDARPNQPVTTAQLENAERRIAHELNRLEAIQKAALGARAQGNLPRNPPRDADRGRRQLSRAAALDRDRGLDADARWFQEQMGEEEVPQDPTIARDINNGMRENDLPRLRDRGRIDDTPLDDAPTTTAAHDPVFKEILEQFLKEAKEDNRALRQLVSLPAGRHT